jgi:branched-chain amino acid transport system permease protein
MFLLMAVVLVIRPWGLVGRPPTPLPAPGIGPGVLTRGVHLPRGAAASVVLLLLLVPLAVPSFVLLLLVEILAFALFAGSLQLLVGSGGLLCFGHAAYFGLGAYGAALLLKQAGLAMPVALALAPLCAAAAALLFGFFCVRLTGISFAMLTLACAQIAYATVQQWYDVTGGDNGILGIWPAPYLATPVRYYYLALLVSAGGLWLLSRIGVSPFGLTLEATRDHAPRCEGLGITVRTQHLLAFVVAGGFAGLGGALFVFLKGSAFPDYLSVSMSIQSLVMVLLGGIHALAGAPAGAALFTGLDTLITLYTDYWQAGLGGVLLLVVLVFPSGLMGFLRSCGAREGESRG